MSILSGLEVMPLPLALPTSASFVGSGKTSLAHLLTNGKPLPRATPTVGCNTFLKVRPLRHFLTYACMPAFADVSVRRTERRAVNLPPSTLSDCMQELTLRSKSNGALAGSASGAACQHAQHDLVFSCIHCSLWSTQKAVMLVGDTSRTTLLRCGTLVRGGLRSSAVGWAYERALLRTTHPGIR